MKRINLFLHEQEVGKHNDVPDEKFDSEQLKIGIDIEKEHTNDIPTRKNIAKDHLNEIPDYYTRLKKLEKSAGITDSVVHERIVEADDDEIQTLQGLKSAAKSVGTAMGLQNQEIGAAKQSGDTEEVSDEQKELNNLKDAMRNINKAIGINIQTKGEPK